MLNEKQKVQLSASVQMDLLPLFRKEAEELETISSQIQNLQSQLDEEVFSIYGIEPASSVRMKDEMAIVL